MSQLTADRRTRLREALAETSCDAVIAASPSNVAYATGYRSVAGELFSSHQMAAVVGPDTTKLVLPAADSAPAVDAGVAPEDLVTYGRFYFEWNGDGYDRPAQLADEHGTFIEALTSAVRSAKLDRASLGVDVAGLGVHWAVVREALSEAALTAATAWFSRVRTLKLPGEVELLMTAARLAETGIDEAIAAAAPRVTERELATVVAAAMVRGGGTPRFLVVTAGPRSALADAAAADRALQPGDLLRFDVGCVVEGYWSDTARTAVVGEPTRTQRDRYAALLAGEEAQLDLLRPGVSAREVFQIAVDTVERSDGGPAPYRRHHCGHGIGADVYEPPIIAPGDATELQEGMTVNVETPYYELGWGGMMVEDTAVITATGHRRLTVSDRSLRVVPA